VPATSDQEIRELCAKVLTSQNSPEFQQAIEALRAALHSQVSAARDKVADFALYTANNSTSQAAD